MLINSRTFLAGSLAAATLLAGTIAVRAGGPQGPATICNPLKGQSGRINYSQTFGVENSSTSSSATIVCPMDFTVDPAVILGPSAIEIAYKARHPTIPVSCTVYAFYEDGFPAFSEEQHDVNNQGSATFDFQVRDAYENLGTEYFTVQCTIPPIANNKRSAIVSWESAQNRL